MTTLASDRLFNEPHTPLKGLIEALTAPFKAPQDEEVPQYRTAAEERELRKELRMLGGD